jgi:hypothetical protein
MLLRGTRRLMMHRTGALRIGQGTSLPVPTAPPEAAVKKVFHARMQPVKYVLTNEKYFTFLAFWIAGMYVGNTFANTVMVSKNPPNPPRVPEEPPEWDGKSHPHATDDDE